MKDSTSAQQALFHVHYGNVWLAGKILADSSDPELRMLAQICESIIDPTETDKKRLWDLLIMYCGSVLGGPQQEARSLSQGAALQRPEIDLDGFPTKSLVDRKKAAEIALRQAEKCERLGDQEKAQLWLSKAVRYEAKRGCDNKQALEGQEAPVALQGGERSLALLRQVGIVVDDAEAAQEQQDRESGSRKKPWWHLW